jgi:hypothetical protein
MIKPKGIVATLMTVSALGSGAVIAEEAEGMAASSGHPAATARGYC